MLDGVSVSNNESDVFNPISQKLSFLINLKANHELVLSIWRSHISLVCERISMEFIIKWNGSWTSKI